jgi:hypothetical protein
MTTALQELVAFLRDDLPFFGNGYAPKAGVIAEWDAGQDSDLANVLVGAGLRPGQVPSFLRRNLEHLGAALGGVMVYRRSRYHKSGAGAFGRLGGGRGSRYEPPSIALRRNER